MLEDARLSLGEHALTERAHELRATARLDTFELLDVRAKLRGRAGRRAREHREESGKLERLNDMIHGHSRDDVAWHLRDERAHGILHDTQTSASLDREHPGASAVLIAGENDADDARSVGCRRRSEERI